ncbi:MAG: YdcF family protein [Thermodesulfovibrio sp.]
MFFLKKFLTSLILPPGILIIIFLLIAVLEKKRKFIRFLAILSALFVYLISIEPVKDLLFYPLERHKAFEELNADAIVILGGGAYSVGSLNEDTLNRLFAGYVVYKKTKLPVIVSGGAIERKISEAAAMAQMLKELGVESGKIIEESKSKDTSQNAFYVSEICRQKNFKKLILVTSAYHMKRAEKLFKKTGLNVLPYPADFKKSNHYNIYSFLPKFSNFALSSKAIREYLALLIV